MGRIKGVPRMVKSIPFVVEYAHHASKLFVVRGKES
jgi:hypothetical protein